MALIECKNCGHRISDKATVCPKCGIPTKEEPKEERKVKSLQDSKGNEEVMYLSAVSCLEEGRLDEARDYIAGLMAMNAEDARYQAIQEKLEQLLSQQQEEIEEQVAKRKKTVWIVLALFFALLMAGGGYWYSQKQMTANELAQWEKIKDADEPELIAAFLNRFPDGEHKAQADERLAYAREEAELWSKIENLSNPSELESFAKKYPKGYYHDLAIAAYDALLWDAAIAKNTLEAYNHYMTQCPQGKHYGEAKEKTEYLEKVQMDEDESQHIASVVKAFFYAMAENNESGMLENVESRLSSFLGKKNASKVDVIAYMRRMHANDVFSVDLTLGEVEVTKLLGKNDEPEYHVSFTFDQRLNREDTSQETFASYKGTTMLNSLMKITSVELSKTAHY